MLGHADIQTTLLYAHLVDDTLRNAGRQTGSCRLKVGS